MYTYHIFILQSFVDRQQFPCCYEQCRNKREWACSFVVCAENSRVLVVCVYFMLFRTLHTDLHNGRTTLHAQQQWTGTPSPHILTAICYYFITWFLCGFFLTL